VHVIDSTARRPKDLPDYFLAHGRHWVTTSDIAEALGGSLVDARQAANRWQTKGLAFSPTRGAYVLIPPEFRTWGAVPASHFIDDMMRFLGHAYYVGYLSAAEIHDAGHQRPQTFQVVTNERLRTRMFGRVHIDFILSAHTVTRPTILANTPTGTINVSTPEATVFDLVSTPERSGGLSNVATIIGDLLDDERLLVDELVRIAHGWSASVVQRAGWLIELVARNLDHSVNLDSLASIGSRLVHPTKLVPSAGLGSLNERWNVIVNTEIEPDR
jgi:predicted transcriptional regulator of viral defense system